MYNKKEWVSKEVITKEALNNIENGIADLDERLENLEDKEVEVDLSDYQEKTDNNLVTESKDIVGAINELFQSANNGKEIIADAIGEPLNAEDTFAAMGNDIKGLLSTFKTNMMNNGVAVESSDKFKSLIDKIATMAEDNSGKGIQFIESIINGTMPNLTWNNGSYSSVLNITFSERLDFTPTLFLVSFSNFSPVYTNNNNFFRSSNIVLDSSLSPFDLNLSNLAFKLYIENVNDSGFTVRVHIDGSTGLTNLGMTVNKFYAIGVGEEDTTLRDSLASILEEEGVEVSEEDDMASLITKVNSELDRKNEEIANSGGLDIISATELPATGKENQICVITDNPTDKFMLSSLYSDLVATDETILGEMTLLPATATVLINNGNLNHRYYFYKFVQNQSVVPSYIYQNGTWNIFTYEFIYLIKDKKEITGLPFGGIYWESSTYPVGMDGNTGLSLSASTSSYTAYVSTENMINFNLFKRVVLKVRYTKDSTYPNRTMSFTVRATTNRVCGGTNTSSLSNKLTSKYTATSQTVPGDNTENYYEFDISSWTGDYYFTITANSSAKLDWIYISEIYFY